MGLVSDPLEAGRAAVQRHAWRDALELLRAADTVTRLVPEDLEAMAESAWWSGLLGACIDARERAYKMYLDAGNNRRAGYVAITLARDYFSKHELSVATAWFNRADRLLEPEPECVEKAWLLRTRAVIAIESERRFEIGIDLARQTLEMATRVKDRDLMALALQDQGRALVSMGKVNEGMALVDEATVAAVAGELTPWVTGAVYCNTITVCQRIVDIRRAGEWSEAAKRWCERQAIAGFPGMCRVYRAEIMRLRGAWREAEQEARRACEELKEFNLGYCSEAFYEVGEIRLHMGDLAGAEDAFRHAHELGRDPQPGLALLRLAEGKLSAALTSIKSAVAGQTRDRLVRAKLLPAFVEIALHNNDLNAAEMVVKELEGIAKEYGTSAFEALALDAAAAVHLARGDAVQAQAKLRESVRIWQDVDAPYGAARTRLMLAEAYRSLGDFDNAALELESARSAFERLGATPDLARTDELLKAAGSAGRRAQSAERAGRTFMFTDIVKSTALVEAIGDEAWAHVVRWHDQTLRSLIAVHSGEEVDHAGDGFFIAFHDARAAMECAVAIQRALAEHRHAHGFAPQVRVGLHASQVVQTGGKYKGKGVHEAARIGALAEGGEIVISSETLAAVPLRFSATNPRTVILKDISQPVTVYTLNWN